MSTNKEEGQTLQQLETVIEKALKKIGATSENEICRYLPMKSGGYMHHFTMRKMKTQTPKELFSMIEEFIIKSESPKEVPHKPRAARGSRKKKNQFALNREDWEKVISFARAAGEKDLVAKLTPQRSAAQVKKDLIASIKQGKVDEELWLNYSETTRSLQNNGEQPEAQAANQIFAFAESK